MVDIDDYYIPRPKPKKSVKVMCRPITNDKGEELGEKHWIYIEKLLKIHREDNIVIEKIKFHYIQAMKHGYKHGVNDRK